MSFKKQTTEQLVKRLIILINDGLQESTLFQTILSECTKRLKISQ